MKQITIFILMLIPFQLFAIEQRPLNGTFSIEGKFGYKSPEKGNSHFYLTFEGATAKALYDAIEVEPYFDDCTGSVIKVQNSMACYKIKNEENYFCNFAINLKTAKIEAGLGNCM